MLRRFRNPRYHGHRLVIGRVPYFAAALQSSFREAHAARVRLDDLCPAAFDHIWRCSAEKTEQAISIDGRVQMRGT